MKTNMFMRFCKGRIDNLKIIIPFIIVANLNILKLTKEVK